MQHAARCIAALPMRESNRMCAVATRAPLNRVASRGLREAMIDGWEVRVGVERPLPNVTEGHDDGHDPGQLAAIVSWSAVFRLGNRRS